mmetsp:Transcript_15776/g.40526  ORF Transcript_15776/g.40526 Transcript_15776/m.40526 type:complete len:113 (-) Transcript_15776:203-541(-)
MMARTGVEYPIPLTERLRDRLSAEDTHNIISVLTTFDAYDLAERYSDRTIIELAEEYEVDVEVIENICNEEEVYLALGTQTRLAKNIEDEIVDRLLDPHRQSSIPVSSVPLA